MLLAKNELNMVHEFGILGKDPIKL